MTEPTAPAANAVLLDEVRYDSPVVDELVAELQQEYVRRYGGPDSAPVDPDQFAPPHGVFLLGRLEPAGPPFGMVGLRRHGDGVVELKRMYVRAAFQRRGLGRALLVAVERRARELGVRRVILETGIVQPEAIGLYTSSGYLPIEKFGYYRESPSSRCFGKDL